MKTIEDLRTINSEAIDKMNQTVEEINNLMPGADLDDEARLIARRASLQAQINNQSLIQAHLKASQVVVPFSSGDETDLDALNDTMDKFIVSGLKVNAMLTLVPKVIDAAISIGNSITAHTGTSA